MRKYKKMLQFSPFLKDNVGRQFCVKKRTIREIQEFWDENGQFYMNQDSGANSFYYSLINMLKIEKRQNILEVGAGSGYLYHHAMMRKHPSAHYTATDLSDEMLVKLCSRIDIEYIPNQRVHHSKYNLSIERANGENLPFHNDTFDCYIANLCLQITTHPEQMVAEAHRVLQKNGYAGFTVWGDKKQSKLFTIVPQILSKQFGIELERIRSNFHLNDRDQLIKMLENAGFTNVICWNQFSPFPYVDEFDVDTFFTFPLVKEQLRQAGTKADQVKQVVKSIFSTTLITEHQPIGLNALLIIAQKQ